MHTIFLAFVAALATARTTRLVTRDRIFSAPRNWVLARLPDGHLFAYLVVCDWCVSVYVGAVFAAAGAVGGSWAWADAVWLALAFSQVTGWMASKEGDE